MDKVGVGIITCDRVDMFNVCFESLSDEWYDELVVVDDGKEEYPLMRRGAEFIRTTGGVGVGKAKNAAIQSLLDKNCDYIILVEDDMKFTGNLFQEYINAYKETGIHHFMFAYHGPANKAGISYGKPVPRKVIDYGDHKIALNQHCVGAVTFYTKESLDFVVEQKCSEDSSAIRPRSDWQSNIKDAFGFFINKHGVSPVQVPDTPVEEVVKTLKTIYNARS